LKKLLAVVFLISVAFAGCGAKEVVKPSDEAVQTTKALGALDRMRAAYAARDMAGVLLGISPDLKEGYSEFQTSLRRDIENYPKVELTVVVDRVEIEDKLVKPVFHWNGKWTDKSGVVHEGRGNCVFGFKDSGQTVAVETLIGDSPFGVVR